MRTRTDIPRIARRSPRRLRVTVFIGFMVALAVAVAAPAQTASAAAIDIPDGGPSPLNILPSVAIGAKAATSSPEALAVMMMQWAKSPAFWRAASAPTPTPAQAAQVADEAASFVVPATKAASLVKVIGPASVLLSGFQVGLMSGNTASRLLGFKDDQVCEQQNAILTAISAVTNGVNCDAFNNQLTELQKNADAAGTSTGPQVCVSGFCLQLVGVKVLVVNGNVTGQTCMLSSGPALPGGFSVAWHWPDGTTSGTSTSGVNSVGGFGNTCITLGAAGRMFSFLTGAVAPLSYYISDTHGVRSPDGVTSTVQGNPARSFVCTIVSTAGHTFTASSPSFTEDDSVLPSPTCPALPAGEVPATTSIKEVGTGTPDTTILPSTPTTPEFQHWKSTYPECGSGTCMLDLRKGTVSCFSNPTGCADWFADPTKLDDYQCFYGSHSVVLEECNVYSPTFKPDAVTTGHQLADPETGLGVPAQTAPNEDAPTFADPVQDPTDTRQCFPTGWGVLNPVEWVMKPVQCALQWAFVPREDVLEADAAEMAGDWAATPPGELIPIVTGWANSVPTLSGCQGPHVAFRFDFWQHISAFGATLPAVAYDGYPMSACDAPASVLAASGRVVGAVIMYFFAARALTRYVGGVVGQRGIGE